jgi:glycerol-3-phosphate dehydrogenase subunit B
VRVAIIGAGIAGAAAAFEIARQGGRAAVFHDLTGSSGLYSGALDFELWDKAHQLRTLSPELVEFAKQLGIWQLGAAARRVATLEGNVRPTRGADSALLDLERCAGKRVAVVDLERDDWDAPLLAKSFASSAWAAQTQTQFFAARAEILQKGFERRISGYDFAALHDAPERAQALQTALRASGVSADAWLFGPWLGIERPLAAELSAALAMPVGETTSAAGGAAGARFEQARDRLLGRLADVERGRLVSLERHDGGYYRLQLQGRAPQDFRAVVLATGGVAAGGVALERSFERRGGTGFRLSFAAPVALELDAEVLEGVSSLANVDFVERGLGALLKVGIAARADGSVRDSPGIFVAGDAIAGRPRTALVAADSGFEAARAALDYGRRTA